MKKLIEGYIAAWNETDAAARAKKIAEVFVEEVEYTDPLASVHGHEALSAMIGGAQEQFAGLTFRISGEPAAPPTSSRRMCGSTRAIPADRSRTPAGAW